LRIKSYDRGKDLIIRSPLRSSGKKGRDSKSKLKLPFKVRIYPLTNEEVDDEDIEDSDMNEDDTKSRFNERRN
jgi:hypothetical protein